MTDTKTDDDRKPCVDRHNYRKTGNTATHIALRCLACASTKMIRHRGELTKEALQVLLDKLNEDGGAPPAPKAATA